MRGYKPHATMAMRAGSWSRAIAYGFGAFLLVGGIGVGLFKLGDWFSWVAFAFGVLTALGIADEWGASCPYCGSRLTFELKDQQIRCKRCEHNLQVDADNRLVVPLDEIPVPIQAGGAEREGGSWGKVAAAGLAGLGLGALAGEAAAEALQDAEEIVDQGPDLSDSV